MYVRSVYDHEYVFGKHVSAADTEETQRIKALLEKLRQKVSDAEISEEIKGGIADRGDSGGS